MSGISILEICYSDDSLVITLVDLWFAGQETTATTLYWAFSYLTLNPEVSPEEKDSCPA